MIKPIGGFFELEVPQGPHVWHESNILALSSGRACLYWLCQKLQPTAIYLPFYICDSVVEALELAAVPFFFYGLNEAMEVAELPLLKSGEYILYVNYFGLKDDYINTLQSHYGDKLWLDLTQSFYYKPAPGQWAFNSARKFFGVPDGAYLFGPAEFAPQVLPPVNKDIKLDHLLWRHLGRQEDAYIAFTEYESHLNGTVFTMSEVSQKWLSWIDHSAVIAQRLANYERYHELLSDVNTWKLSDQLHGIPFCYPLRLPININRQQLFSQSIYVPWLWKEVQTRKDSGIFLWENSLVDQLLPLPIDHRYGLLDIERVVKAILKLL